MHADPRQAARIGRKRLLCRLLHWPTYAGCWLLLRLFGGYRIADLANIRHRFREVSDRPGPLLICANHLTYIDSMLMIWAFGSVRWYWTHYSRLSWNLPAEDVFGRKRLFRAVAAISKCIFVNREGSLRHKDDILRLCRDLLAAGEIVTIFPEGGRSRTGRFEVEKLTSGAGKIVAGLGDCRVLCVYLRSDRQERYANYPPRGSEFHVDMAIMEFDAEATANLSYREITAAIGERISQLEQHYFAKARP